MIAMLLKGLCALGFIAVSAMFLIWLERKVSARIQTRLGPMMTGPHGTLQPIADTIKLLLKEDIVPNGVDFLSWWLAPFFVTVPVVMAFLVIPFSAKMSILDLNVGVLYICSVTSLCVLGIFMAGWGSNNKYSLLEGYRSPPQLIVLKFRLFFFFLLLLFKLAT